MPILLRTIKKRIDFLKISKKGKRKFTKGFLIQENKRDSINDLPEEKNTIRIGFTVTKKVGTATVRNKIKRKLRSLSKDVLLDKGKKNYDYIIIPNKRILLMNYKELKKDLINFLK